MDIFHYPHSPTNTLQRDEFWERVCVPGVPGHAARLDGAGRRQEARGESRRHRRLQQHARLPQHLREITVIYYILCFIDTRKLINVLHMLSQIIANITYPVYKKNKTLHSRQESLNYSRLLPPPHILSAANDVWIILPPSHITPAQSWLLRCRKGCIKVAKYESFCGDNV